MRAATHLVVVNLSLDEAALEVGVDGSRRLWCGPAIANRPALDLHAKAQEEGAHMNDRKTGTRHTRQEAGKGSSSFTEVRPRRTLCMKLRTRSGFDKRLLSQVKGPRAASEATVRWAGGQWCENGGEQPVRCTSSGPHV
jgi:hypothetical protein